MQVLQENRLTATTEDCVRTARAIYADSPWLQRHMQQYRPYICPMDVLLTYVPDGSRILDIGCGRGLFLSLVASTRPNSRGTGVDISAAALVRARRAAEHLKSMGVRTAPEYHLVSDPKDWPGGQYDVVSIIDVIHHVPRAGQRDFLAAAARRVRAGGTLLFKDMCRRPRWRSLANRLHDFVVSGQYIHEVEPASVQEWMRAHELTMVHGARLNRWWYGHDLCVFRKG